MSYPLVTDRNKNLYGAQPYEYYKLEPIEFEKLVRNKYKEDYAINITLRNYKEYWSKKASTKLMTETDPEKIKNIQDLINKKQYYYAANL